MFGRYFEIGPFNIIGIRVKKPNKAKVKNLCYRTKTIALQVDVIYLHIWIKFPNQIHMGYPSSTLLKSNSLSLWQFSDRWRHRRTC